MAITQTFYINGASLGSSTAVFLDADLTVCAPDGFYSDGAIVRQQVECVLLPAQTCPSCSSDCGDSVLSFVGDKGVYNINVNMGTATGAIIVRFNPFTVPLGIQGVFIGVEHNRLSSPVYGVLEGSPALPTYIGNSASDCGLVAGSPHTLEVFNFDGTSFVDSGATESVTILVGQLDLTVADPGQCVMVIPNTSGLTEVLALKIIAACDGSAFNITVNCPAALPSFLSSVVDATDPCALPLDQTYYVAYVNGAAGTLGLYDFVFSDENGEFPLSDGYYLAPTSVPSPNSWFRVSDGVIVEFGACALDSIDYDVINAITPPCDVNASVNLTLEQFGVTVLTENAPASGTTSISDVTTDAILTVNWIQTEPCTDDITLVIEIDSVSVEVQTFTPVTGGTYQITYSFNPTGVTNITGILYQGTP